MIVPTIFINLQISDIKIKKHSSTFVKCTPIKTQRLENAVLITADRQTMLCDTCIVFLDVGMILFNAIVKYGYDHVLTSDALAPDGIHVHIQTISSILYDTSTQQHPPSTAGRP